MNKKEFEEKYYDGMDKLREGEPINLVGELWQWIEQYAKEKKGKLSCPFCKDNEDYDLIGLKYHFTKCDDYLNTENIF